MQLSPLKRYDFIDFLRGIAVILMIFFHFAYDLSAFGFIEINFQKDMFWYFLPRLIVTLFLLAVGLSLAASDKTKKIYTRSYFLRLAKIAAGAIAISVFTWFFFRANWIYFGTLHCIFFVTILITPFIHRPNLSLAIAILIWGLNFTKYAIPFYELKHPAMDYIPLFPWVAVSFLALFLNKFHISKISIASNKCSDFVLTLGKNSFKIYLLHQPILYALVYLFSVLLASK